MNGEESGSEKRKYKTKVAFNMNSERNDEPVFSGMTIFISY